MAVEGPGATNRTIGPSADPQQEPEEQAAPGFAARFLTRLVEAPEISLVIALILFGLLVQSRNSQFLTFENLILVVKAAVPVLMLRRR